VLLGALAMFSNDLAIDLGTANTCVFARGHGIVLNEPSIVALNTVNARVEAVGSEAKAMVGRTPGCIAAIKPMRDGVIADFDAAEKMLDYFIKKAHGKRRFVRPRVVIGVPSGITQVERRAVRDSAHRARASEVYLVEEGMAAAIGAGLPITEACGSMIVDIGGGTTDICVISLAGIVYSRSLRVAGNAMDEAIANYVKREKDLLIGERTAEQIKIELGSAAPLPERKELEVKGRHVVQGKPMTVTLNDQEVRGALEDPIRQIVQAVRNLPLQPTVAASNCESAKGSASASPCTHSIVPDLRRARSSMRSEKSRPTTRPPRRSASSARSPVPQQASSTRSPGHTTCAAARRRHRPSSPAVIRRFIRS